MTWHTDSIQFDLGQDHGSKFTVFDDEKCAFWIAAPLSFHWHNSAVCVTYVMCPSEIKLPLLQDILCSNWPPFAMTHA